MADLVLCSDCKFAVTVSIPTGDVIECRCHPPVVVAGAQGRETFFPIVDEDDSCSIGELTFSARLEYEANLVDEATLAMLQWRRNFVAAQSP